MGASILQMDVGKAAKQLLLRDPGPEPKHYPNFDLLRLVSAASVVTMHCHNSIANGHHGGVFWGGLFFAVPLFLALSGFLVLKSFTETPSWPRFAWKRLCRVIPAWLASFVLVALISGFAACLGCLKVWATLGLTLGYGGSSVNGPLWSLGWEELFYAGLAVLYLAGAYQKPVAIWLLAGVSTFVCWQTIDNIHELHRVAMCALPSSFFLGNLVYIYCAQLRRLRPALALGLLVGAVIANYYRGYDQADQFILQHALLLAALLASIAGPTLLAFAIPDISYGIYVYHAPIVNLLVNEGKATQWALLSSTALAVLPLAIASWFLLEKPALKLKNARFRWPRIGHKCHRGLPSTRHRGPGPRSAVLLGRVLASDPCRICSRRVITRTQTRDRKSVV